MNPWLAVAALVLVLDQATKYAAEAWLRLHEPVAIFPGFNLTLVYNPGAAFSFLGDAGGWQRWLFVAVATAASIFVYIWLRRVPREDWPTALALALVLGGAIGNLWDRVVPHREMVVDFLDFYVGRAHWPAFNLADCGIVGGVIILCITAVWQPKGTRVDES